MAENKPSDLKVVLTWQELLHETSTFFKTYLLPPVLEESEPPTFPHTTATSLTPRPQSVSGVIGYKNLICQIREGGNVRGTAVAAGESTAGAGLGRGNGAGLVQDPCARGFPQAGTAGTIPTAPPAVPGGEDRPRARRQLSPAPLPNPGKFPAFPAGTAQLCPHPPHPNLPSLNSFSATNPRFARLNQSSINILFKKNKPQMQTFTKKGRKVTVK